LFAAFCRVVSEVVQGALLDAHVVDAVHPGESWALEDTLVQAYPGVVVAIGGRWACLFAGVGDVDAVEELWRLGAL